MTLDRPYVKKIKPDSRKILSLYNKKIVGEKNVFLHIGEENYEIFKGLTKEHRIQILVEIERNSESKIVLRIDTNPENEV